MRARRLITLAAIALAIVSIAVPAVAQTGGNNGKRRARDREVSAAQSGGQGQQARGGEAMRRQSPNANPTRASGTGDRRTAAGEAPARSPDNRSYATTNGGTRGADQNRSGAGSNANRSYAQPRSNAGGYDNRSNGGYDNRAYGSQSYGNRAYDSRAYGNPGYGNPGYGARDYDNRAYGHGGYGGYDWNRYGWYGSYNRNAWHNQVHFGLGVSLFAGSPFSFRFAYGWQPSFRYRYSVSPGMAYGGMSFLLNPDYAEVYIDSQFVGVARDFGGQPVPVPAGYHRIELYAPGFRPVAFDINVMPGQVIPYRGSLYPVY
jgi:hypothetical protein